LLNNILIKLASPILSRNRKFKDIHKGESCYIFGNGVSLKDMNFNHYGDKIGFGCNFLFFHKDFNKLNVRYYTEPPPYWYYPYWKNPYTGEKDINRLSLLQRKYQKRYDSIKYFVNLSNLPVLFGHNIFYLHHFGAKTPDTKSFDLSGKYFYTGALHAMIGMAIYMGFSKALLIGCDYTHSPQRILHYYEKGKGKKHFSDDYNLEYFALAKELIDLVTITNNNSVSKTIKYVSYSDYTGVAESVSENYDLVEPAILAVLNEWGGYEVY
jgi:hypothetical protein